MRPATGEDFALVLPEVSTVAMAIFLEGVAGALPAHVHGVMALDRAGWHGSKKLTVPNKTSASRRCRPTAPNSIPPSVSGCFCASVSFPFGSATTRKPPSMPAATPGMPSPPKPAASNHYPATHGSQKSVHRFGGITSLRRRGKPARCPAAPDRPDGRSGRRRCRCRCGCAGPGASRARSGRER